MYKILDPSIWNKMFQDNLQLDVCCEYLRFIECRLNHEPNTNCEIHHILPKSLDHNSEYSHECVRLSYKDHYHAHLLLKEMFIAGSERRSMVYAAYRMSRYHDLTTHISSDDYSKLKSEFREVQRAAKLGEKNPNYNKKMSDSQKKLLSEKMSGENNPFYGKHHSEETRRKLSEIVKNNHEYRPRGESHYLYGKHPSESTRAKMSDAHKGAKNPLYGKKALADPEGHTHYVDPDQVEILMSQGWTKSKRSKRNKSHDS